MVPAFPTGCWQLTLLPSHSSRVQGFPSDVQLVPVGLRASAGQVVLVPLQVSAGSQGPADARQGVPAGAAVPLVQIFPPPPWGFWHVSLTVQELPSSHGSPTCLPAQGLASAVNVVCA